MPETDARDILPKLGRKSDWKDWMRSVGREAERLGVATHLDNVVVHNQPRGVNTGTTSHERTTQQKWRNLKDAILRSLHKSAESYMKNKDCLLYTSPSPRD